MRSARTAIIAALPREISGLVRGIKPDEALVARGIYRYALQSTVIVAAGMGCDRAALAVESAMQTGVIATLISAGLAGSCEQTVSAGSVLEANIVVDARTGERLLTASQAADATHPIVLVTSPAIASIQEKARLHEAYHAQMVDMEAAMVGRLARAHGIPFRAIKGISDGHQFELASLARCAGAHGSFRTGAFALHTALRPWTWSAALQLGLGSAQALKALERTLRAQLDLS